MLRQHLHQIEAHMNRLKVAGASDRLAASEAAEGEPTLVSCFRVASVRMNLRSSVVLLCLFLFSFLFFLLLCVSLYQTVVLLCVAVSDVQLRRQVFRQFRR